MHTNMQYLSSRYGVYSGICGVVTVIYLILLSSTREFHHNVEYITNQKQVIKPDAGSFVYLTHDLQLTLAWLTLIGMFVLTIIAVRQHSMPMVLIPSIVFIVATALIGTGYFDIGSSWFTSRPIGPVAIMMCLGAARVAFFNRKRAILSSAAGESPAAASSSV